MNQRKNADLGGFVKRPLWIFIDLAVTSDADFKRSVAGPVNQLFVKPPKIARCRPVDLQFLTFFSRIAFFVSSKCQDDI